MYAYSRFKPTYDEFKPLILGIYIWFDIQNDSLLFNGAYLFNTGVNRMMFFDA